MFIQIWEDVEESIQPSHKQHLTLWGCDCGNGVERHYKNKGKGMKWCNMKSLQSQTREQRREENWSFHSSIHVSWYPLVFPCQTSALLGNCSSPDSREMIPKFQSSWCFPLPLMASNMSLFHFGWQGSQSVREETKGWTWSKVENGMSRLSLNEQDRSERESRGNIDEFKAHIRGWRT